MEDILVVYDRETYDGYITYDSYVKSSGSEREGEYISASSVRKLAAII